MSLNPTGSAARFSEGLLYHEFLLILELQADGSECCHVQFRSPFVIAISNCNRNCATFTTNQTCVCCSTSDTLIQSSTVEFEWPDPLAECLMSDALPVLPPLRLIVSRRLSGTHCGVSRKQRLRPSIGRWGKRQSRGSNSARQRLPI
jgi:hypothetical protein